MDREDYVSYEVAMLLKEKGFDEICENAYNIDNKDSFHGLPEDYYSPYKNHILIYEVTAPLLSHAQKWLRKEHDIKVMPQFDIEEYTNKPLGYSFDIWIGKEYDNFCMGFDTYEAALNEGIKRALKHI